MPNFDALRAAPLGALSYICRPKEKPVELLALFPFNENLADLSRYGRAYTTSSTVSYVDGPFGGKGVTAVGMVTVPESSVFTVDFFAKFTTTKDYTTITINGRLSGANGNLGYSSNGGGGIGTFNTWNATGNSNANVIAAGTSWAHYAIVCTGTTGRVFVDGVLKKSVDGTYNALTMFDTKINASLCNLRIVAKALGTTSSFPVPSDYYTGYEPLNGGGVILPRSSKFTPRRRRIAPVAVMGGRA